MRPVREIIAAMACFTTKQKPCESCAFNPRPGVKWAYGCGRGERDIVIAAREVLRDYERRCGDGDDRGEAAR